MRRWCPVTERGRRLAREAVCLLVRLSRDGQPSKGPCLGGLGSGTVRHSLFFLILKFKKNVCYVGGGLPYSKTFEELFCLSLDIFQEEGGGLPDSKDDEVLFSALA